MRIHIVKPNETIKDISKRYNLTLDEIKSANTHFRSWEHLAPGVKIKLPEIPEYVSEEIDLIEPFIEDYYPELEVDNIKTTETIKTDVIEDQKNDIKNNNLKPANKKTNKYYYPWYMYYGYPFYRKR